MAVKTQGQSPTGPITVGRALSHVSDQTRVEWRMLPGSLCHLGLAERRKRPTPGVSSGEEEVLLEGRPGVDRVRARFGR